MIRYRFPEADRKRLGIPDVVEFDANKPRLSEVRALRDQVGMSFGDLSAKLRPVEGAIEWEALGILFWLVAVRGGAKVNWSDFDVDLDAVEMEAVEGNPPAPDGASNS